MIMIDFIAHHLDAYHEEAYIKLRDACSKGHHHVAQNILEGLGPETSLIVNATPGGANTLLFSACEDGHEEIVQLLLNFGAEARVNHVTRYSPLYIACYHGRLSIVRLLILKFPPLVNVETVERWLPIHGAAINNHVKVVQELLEHPYPSEVMLRFLHHSGQFEYDFPFDVNAQDATGKTILYIASFLGNLPLVELLLKFRLPGYTVTRNPEQEAGDSPESASAKFSPSHSSKSTFTKNPSSGPSRSQNVTSPAFSPSPDLEKDQNSNSHKQVEIAPIFIDIYCNYGSETALQAAIKRRHYSIASILLQNGSDPNLTIRPPSSCDETETSSPKFSVSTCLVEASKLRESSLVDLLIRFGARDDNRAALEIASKNKDNHLISKLLSLKSFPDPEFKIYKKAIEFSGFSSSNAPTSVTVSSIFPSVPVMINWYGIKFVRQIEKQWLINACISHNIKFKLNNQNQAIVLNAITRLDLSSNNFTSVPLCIFQLPSLRVLNLANNHLASLPEIEDELPISHSGGGMKKSRSHSSNISKFSQPKCSWFLPCLEELYLQNNRIELLSPCVFELPSLHLLDLSSNRITALPNRLWSAPKLRDLNLSSNLLRELPLKLSPVISSSFKEKPNSDDFLNSFEDSEIQRPLEAFKQKPLQRINLWEREIPLVSATYIENTDNLSAQNPLNSLNLSHNAFSELPINLSCLAINLNRLNMSHNYLKAVGDVKLYPANLKHLDVSHNQIKEWIIPIESCSDCAKYSICYGFSTSNEPIPITKGKNSKKSKYCIHKQHTRLEALKTLIISHNLLTKIMIIVDQDFEHLDVESKAQSRYQARTLFPNLSMLDISFNRLAKLTPKISELTHLSVLNISGNPNIHHLPPEMGLASKLWNLSTNGCNLGEPLRTMIDSKKYKTMDIIGYLKSILENSRPYARMKLMLVGVQGIGKTSLLEQLRQEGHGSYRKKPPEHWAKRMGKQNIGIKTPKGVTLSTVGVDVCDWTFEKRVRGQHSFGPVTFRTWDFGGQEEYYATHQYFLSRRSLYLVLWKMIDGEKAIENIHKWLVNIQARAPNAPVIIVGTHQDLMGEYYPRLYSEYLQQIIRDRFINIIDSDKLGLPRVVESIEISIKTRYNIKRLCNLIYDTVFELRSSGSKERLLEQKVPATYIALEEVVSFLANERLSEGKDPILVGDQFKSKVSSEMYRRFGLSFRDAAELRQATAFLHENGVLLHYEDATLKDLFFLDAQWLCDQLANVVTIREINPYARNGIMKTDDLKHLFRTTELSQSDMKFYIINLLNKFEVALTWDSRTLLIPSLLPSENAMLSHGCGVSISIRTRSWGSRTRYGTTSSESDANAPISPEKQASPSIITINRPEKAIHRLLLMTYFPSGFWSRLISRVLAEENIEEIIRNFYGIPSEVGNDLQNFASGKSEWICWQTGFALKHLGHQVFRVKEITLSIENPLFEYYQQNPFLIKQEGIWIDVEISKSSILEIHFPNHLMQIITSSANHTLQPNIEYLTKLLSMIVDHIDTLLEDWYPTLGTRFVHTSEGKFLVTRIVPCTKCLLASEETFESGTIQATGSSENSTPNGPPKVEIQSWRESSGGRKSSTSSSLKGRNSNIGSVRSVNSQDSGVDDDGSVSSRNTSLDNARKSVSRVDQIDIPSITGKKRLAIYSFMVEECIMLASQEKTVTCPVHNQLDLKEIAPDIMFLDLSQQYLIKSEWIRRGKMLGRGAFGFVFRASLRKKNSVVLTEVAMKALQPVNPGQGARDSDSAAFKAASHKCDRDPMQFACKAYCIARQEISILLSLRHSNIVPLIGVCTHPLALILQLAPLGALDLMIKEYRRSGARMNPHVVQKVIHQVAKALEYLHQQRIIYRDLKSENVLIWEMPKPYSSSKSSSSEMRVEIKLADYGISRAILPTGTKGFAGTEGFMAPEIMRYNGEEEYTEKVDCFSFAMFIYELISLRQPFEGQECVKDNILEGGRPLLTDHDILYPTNFLDLMVLCWSQSPENRPSTSQIVSITSAPEFVHLLDVVILAGNSTSLCAGLIPHPEFSFFDVFIGRQGEHLDLLMGNSHTWTEYRSFVGSEGNAAITAICLVRSYLWLADAEAIIHIFTCDSYQEIDSFVINPKDETLVTVREIEFLDSIECVAILTTSGRIIVCDVNTMTLSEIEMRNSDSLCLAYVNPYIEPDAKTCELWCGQAKGFLTIVTVTVEKDHVVTAIVATIDHQMSENSDPNDSSRLDVSKIAAETKYVSTYLFPGSMIYQWDAKSRTLLHKLDCSKLLPCSESIISIGIEEEVSREYFILSKAMSLCFSGQSMIRNSLIAIDLFQNMFSIQTNISHPHSVENFQVTSMAVIDQELIVGTAWGCMTIIESSTMRPVTVFRPYEEEIKHILPFKKEEFAFHRKRDSTCSSSISISSTTLDEDKYIVTIGKGFRNLANRFVKDREGEVKSHLNELVCILWKSGHWINN